MTYDDAIQIYDKMDNLQQAGVSIRLYNIASKVNGETPAKEILRLAIIDEINQRPLPE